MKPKKICIIGCGGTGSLLARILDAAGHRLTLIDGDRLEPRNAERQITYPREDCEQRLHKCISLHRRLLHPGNHTTVPEHIPVDETWYPPSGIHCVVLCVDNWSARNSVLRGLPQIPVINCGNTLREASAQLFVFCPRKTKWPFPNEFLPELLRAREADIEAGNLFPDDDAPDCHETVARGDQSMEANMAAAIMAAGLIRTWIEPGVFIDSPSSLKLDAGQMRCIPWRHSMAPSHFCSYTLNDDYMEGGALYEEKHTG
jgi:molybdopterin/thiamine biosynthesis adenylyltransferase